MGKDALSTRIEGNHPYKTAIVDFYKGRGSVTSEEKDILECHEVEKVKDLRYGTNPRQTAALYNPNSFLGSLKEHRTGKEGASQTNMEDIYFAAIMEGYFEDPAVMIMKHENPSGFATAYKPEPLWLTYKKARDTDFRAGFGGTVYFNRPVDKDAADATKELFTEVVVAPGFEEGVMEKFKGSTRVFEYDEKAFKNIPRYTEDRAGVETRVFSDGSTIRADTYLLPIKNINDLRYHVASKRQPSDRELMDLLTGLRLNKIRSNSIRLIKDGYTTGLGVSQQDRVMCIDIAAYKNRKLAELAEKEKIVRVADYSIPGSVLVSDGFFPFDDSIILAKELGVTAVLAPHGGNKFQEVLEKADELGIAFVDLKDWMRFFEHH